MSNIELPEEVVSPYADLIPDVAQHLRQADHIDSNEVVVSAEIKFRANQPVVLKDYKTRTVDSTELR